MTFTRIRRSLVPLVAVVAFARCSGGSGSSTGSTVPSKPIVSGALVLRLPAAHGALDARRAAFVSSGTASARVAVTGIATDVIANISPTSANCVTTATGLTCTVPIAAPAGSDTFTVTLYSAANATGQVLGSGSTLQTIAGPASFSVTVPIVAVPASITVSPVPSSGTTFVLGQSNTAQLQVNLNDAAATPVAITGSYPTPITVTSDDTTSAFTVSPATLTSSSQMLTVSYNGSTTVTSAVLTLSAGSAITTQIAVCSVWCLSQNASVPIAFPPITDATFSGTINGSPAPATVSWAFAGPAGTTGTFASTTTASGLGNSLTIAASPGSAPLASGQTTFNVAVTGAGGATATTTYPLVVTPPVAILVAGDDGCVVACVAPGGTATINFTNPPPPFPGAVLSWTAAVPTNWTPVPTFTPASTAPTTSTVETVQTAATSAPGGYLTSATASYAFTTPVTTTFYQLINLVANGPPQVTLSSHARIGANARR